MKKHGLGAAVVEELRPASCRVMGGSLRHTVPQPPILTLLRIENTGMRGSSIEAKVGGFGATCYWHKIAALKRLPGFWASVTLCLHEVHLFYWYPPKVFEQRLCALQPTQYEPNILGEPQVVCRNIVASWP